MKNLFLILLLVLPGSGLAQETQGVLTPAEMEAEVGAAGYRLDRIETFLEDNNLYLYIFRPEPASG